MEESKIRVMNLIYGMSDGGAQRIVLNYLRDLKDDKDINLKLFVYNKPTDSYCERVIKNENLNVEYIYTRKSKIKIPYIKRYFNSRIAKKEWDNAIKKFKPDIVHVHISELLTNTISAISNNNVPIRFDTLHSNPLRYKGKKLKIIRQAFQKENFIPICVTKEQEKVAKQYYGFSKSEVLYNGIDIKDIKCKIVDKKSARNILNIPEDSFVIIGVGRLDKIKRFDLLINAFNYISKNNSKAILIIAGQGPEYKKLNKKVKKLKLESKVRFIGQLDNVIPLYCAADMLGITSSSESSSLVLLESQICGLRSVISAGVPQESIISEKIQVMNKNATVKQWASALQNTNFQGKAVSNIENYDVHEISKKLKNIYLKYWEEYNNNEK